jgi:hypothetical protein
VEELTNRIKQIRFLPRNSDNNLRCKGFPPYNPASAIYAPSNVVTIDNVLSSLDLLVAESMIRPAEFMNYVIVYAGKTMSDRDYNRLFARYEVHIYKKRQASPRRIRLVKGGRRGSFLGEVFYLRKGDPPPVSAPDFASPLFR